jgi:hypothetical protein
MLSQPDVKRSSVIEESVLVIYWFSFLAPFKGERLYYFVRNSCDPCFQPGFVCSTFCGHFLLSSDLEENSLLQWVQTYFVWVCAGMMVNQPDARRSSVAVERVLIMGWYFVLDPQKARVFLRQSSRSLWFCGGRDPKLGYLNQQEIFSD